MHQVLCGSRFDLVYLLGMATISIALNTAVGDRKHGRAIVSGLLASDMQWVWKTVPISAGWVLNVAW